MSRIVCVGEGMLELRREHGEWRLGSGGDVLNTAIHLARLGHDVAFLSALGNDPMVPVTIREGRVTVGFFPVGRIPPLP